MKRMSIWLAGAIAAAMIATPAAFAAEHGASKTGPSAETAMSQSGKSRAEIAAFELQTAAKHAGFAAQAKDAETAHKHLQHALNCLVGKDDPAYDASAEDPCKGEGGQGAIADARQAPTSQKTEHTLEQAKQVAMKGRQEGESNATAAAKRLQSLLQQAEQTVSAEGRASQ